MSAASTSPDVPVAVTDSSVLVPVWSRYVLQRLAAGAAPPYRPAWSEWIIAETWRVLTEQWFERFGGVTAPGVGRLDDLANGMLRRLLRVMHLVSLRGYAGPGAWPELADADDEPVWQTAVAAGAQYVISNNTRHFPPLVSGRHLYGGVEYVTAIEFIEDILGKDAAAVYERPLPGGAQLRSRRARR